MSSRNLWVSAAAGVLAAAMACSPSPSAPQSPAAAVAGTAAAADGSTLKVTAPAPQSPIGGAQPEGELQLVANTSATRFAGPLALSYRFEIMNAGGTTVCSGLGVVSGSTATFTPGSANCALDFDTAHTWRARAEFQGAAGPWSSAASFKSPIGGYIRNNEIYDPLTNGKTVGHIAHDVTFLPEGVRLNSRDSYVEYVFPTPLTDGEMSAEMTNIGNGSEEWKTKVLSMLEGPDTNVTENDYRVTIDKRTTWENQGSRIRYTMRSRGIDAGEPRGGDQNWSRSKVYFWAFEWRNGMSRLRVYEGGRNGRLMEDLSVRYAAPYSPTPHVIRLGSVGGRAGNDTNPGTIIRNFWVSARPRPNLPGETR